MLKSKLALRDGARLKEQDVTWSYRHAYDDTIKSQEERTVAAQYIKKWGVGGCI